METGSPKDQRNRAWLKTNAKKNATDLEVEVQQGECALIFNSEGSPVRVALIVCLRVVRGDGLMLVQVAKLTDGCIVPKLQMLATKVKDGEHLTDAAQRLIRLRLAPLGEVGNLGITRTHQKKCETYGLETRFFQTVFTVPFTPSALGPGLIVSAADAPPRTSLRSGMPVFGSSMSQSSLNGLPREFHLVLGS